MTTYQETGFVPTAPRFLAALCLLPALSCLPAGARATDAVESAAALRFPIERFDVQGGAPLTPAEIEAVLRPYTGPARTFEDVQRAAAVLETEYRQRGYAAVQVILPEQTLEGGVVRLEVLQARIGRITVTNNQRFSEDNLRRSLPALKEGEPPNIAAISQASQVANQSPAKEVRVLLKPTDVPGRVDATIDVVREERPARFFASIDNTGTQATGRDRTSVGFQHSNLFDRDHILTAQFTTSAEKSDKVTIGTLGYRIPLYGLGDSIDAYAGYSDVDSGQSTTPLGPLAISGRGALGGLRYNWSLRRIGEYEHRVILGADYRRFDSVCTLGDLGPEGCISAGIAPGRVSVLPLSIGYAAGWAPPGRRLDLYANVSRNVPFGGSGDAGAFRRAQANAEPGFTVLRLGVSMASAFAGDWQWRIAGTGQASGDPLIPGERLGAGGYNTVRGFLEREVLGDSGLIGNAELYTPDLAARLGWGRFSLRVLAFTDWANVKTNDPLPGAAAHQSLGSAGIGVRGGWSRDVSLRLDAASVFDSAGQQRRGDVMLHAGLVVLF